MLKKYNEVDKTSLNSLNYKLKLKEHDILNDSAVLDLSLIIENKNEKPAYIKDKDFTLRASSESLSKNVNFEGPNTKRNTEFLIYGGTTIKFIKLDPFQSISIPLFFFNNDFNYLVNKDNETVVNKCVENKDFEIDVKIKSSFKDREIDKLIISRDDLIDRIGEIKGIDNYDKYIFLEKL